jgi:heat shock protein HslJ
MAQQATLRGLGLVCCVAFLVIGCQSVAPTAQSPAAATTRDASTLVGTSWIAEEIAGSGVLDQVQSTLTFESAERIAGSTGCNRYFAPLQLTDTTLRFGSGGSTRRACPPAVMDQESRFLAALEAVRAYRRDGNALWLLDDSGRTRMHLTRLSTDTAR